MPVWEVIGGEQTGGLVVRAGDARLLSWLVILH